MHAIVATGAHDLLESAADVRLRRVDAFEDLLAGLQARFQLLVTSRRVALRWEGSARVAAYLEELTARDPAFTRRAYLVLSDAPTELQRWVAAAGGRRRPAGSGAEGLLREARAACTRLRALGLEAWLLEGRELDRFLDESLPPCVSRGVDADWVETPGWLSLDGGYRRSHYLDAFPGVALEAGWLGAFVDIDGEFDLAIHGMRIPAPAALRSLNTRIRNLQAARLADGAGPGALDPLVEAGLPEAIGLRRELAANEQAVFVASVTLTLRAGDEAELTTLAHAVEAAAARSMARLLPATLQMAPACLTTLPLGIDAVGVEKMLPGAVLATTYPWLWEELQQPRGRLVGVKLRGGAPVLLDTFDERRFPNANLTVFGHSGAGKTYLVKSLLRADVEAGVGAFVVDPESEYRDLCDSCGGQWVDLSLGSAHRINVMDPALVTTDERDPMGDQASDLVDLLATMCGAVTEDERVDLDDVLRDLLATPAPTLRALRAELEARAVAPRVARSLRRWTEGPLGDLFAAPTNVRFDAPLTVFALRDLKDELVPVAYFLIAQWIWARVRAERRPRRILFDEVGLMFEHPVVRRFLVRLARRVRKYEGSLCLITQNAGDLLGSDAGLVLATNAAVTFVGAQRPAEAQRLQRALALTDAQAAFLGRARRGEFLLLGGESRHRIRVVAPPA